MRFDPAPLRLLPTPGHTPDHHVVWDAERETMFSGDLFLSVKMRLAQDAEDVHGVVRSLHAVIALKPKRVFCAHRGPVHDPVNTLRAKAAWMEEIIGEARRSRRTGMTGARDHAPLARPRRLDEFHLARKTRARGT